MKRRSPPLPFSLARLLAAGLLVLALARWPYGYYQLLRWAVCGVGAWGVIEALAAERRGWATVFGALAVLFNPIAPIRFDRDTWRVLDVATAGVLALSIGWVRGRR